jgi:subtilisin family serine protease
MWGPMRVQGYTRPEDGVTASTGAVTVCVVDTGINWNHPKLRSQVVPIYNLNFAYDVANTGTVAGIPVPDEDLNDYCVDANDQQYPCAYDDDGHGSHVSGIIAAQDKFNDGQDVVGIAPTAQLLAVKALGYHWVPNPNYGMPGEDPYVYDSFGYESDLANSIYACVANGAQVINMSWGSLDDSDIIHDAVSTAYMSGVILVAAAGNLYDPTLDYGPVAFPAHWPEVLSIAALDLNGQIAPFSSRGNKVDFIAPGVSILSTTLQGQTVVNLGMYEYYSGTSMAAPHVTGAIARLLAIEPWADSRDLVGTDIGLDRTYQGAGGLINVELSCRK